MYKLSAHLHGEYEKINNSVMAEPVKRSWLLDVRHRDVAASFHPFISPYDDKTVLSGADVPIAQFTDARLAALFVLSFAWWPIISKHVVESPDVSQ